MAYLNITRHHTMISNYFQKNEPSIAREISKKCLLCYREFRLGRSEHQCKRCLRAICSDCGKEKIVIFKTGFEKHPHRGCKVCVQEIDTLHQYISDNKIVFGKMSLIGERWMKKIQRNASYLPSQIKKKSQFRRDIFRRMWDSYSYSMREFIGLLTYDKHQQEIYQAVSEVIKTVFSVFPLQYLESVAYLSIFFLCFSTVEKATLLCLHSIQLKNQVSDSEGLFQAYLKSLCLASLPKIKEYAMQTGPKYIQTLSVNYSSITSSIYLIDKVITRRKMDEVYIFFSISVDIIKDSILYGKMDYCMLNFLLARNCSPNGVSIKYRQAAEIDSSPFMAPREEKCLINNLTTMEMIEDIHSIDKDNALSSSFNDPIRRIGAESPIYNKNKEYLVARDRAGLQKKGGQIDQQSFNQTNMSAISLIEQMKDLQRGNPQPSDGKQILALLSGAEFKSINDSQELRFADDSSQQPKFHPMGFTKQTQKEFCQKCESKNKEIQSLNKELRQYYHVSDMVDTLKQQTEQLKDKLKKTERQLSIKAVRQLSDRQNTLIIQKTQLQAKIRRLKQSLSQYQSTQKENRELKQKTGQLTTKIKNAQSQLQNYKLQLLQSSSTIRTLQSKLQSSHNDSQISQKHSQSTDTSFYESKVIQMLKQNMKEKNFQVEELVKKNKLLCYQLNQLSKSSQEGMLRNQIEAVTKEKDGLLNKIEQLSMLMMNEEEEKLRLSQENFMLRQVLKCHKIAYEF